MASPQRSLSMMLLIDKKTKRVLFAEARNDVIDFLFSLLTIPLGSIVELFTKESMVGSIGNLYKSVEAIDESYIISNEEARSSLLNPAIAAAEITHFLTESSSTTSAAKKYYRCPGNHSTAKYFTDVYGIACPNCRSEMTKEMSYLDPNSESVAVEAADAVCGGFMMPGLNYCVMDDLTLASMSTISSIMVLNKFNVKNVGSLKKRKVNLGTKEVIGLLKASLQSKTVLTDVFVGKKLGIESTSSLIKA